MKRIDDFLSSPLAVLIFIIIAFGLGYVTGEDRSLEDVKVVSK